MWTLSLRCFLAIGLNEAPPDHSTISRTCRLIDLETHRQVFTWVLKVLAEAGLLKGKRPGENSPSIGLPR
jgi:transposase